VKNPVAPTTTPPSTSICSEHNAAHIQKGLLQTAVRADTCAVLVVRSVAWTLGASASACTRTSSRCGTLEGRFLDVTMSCLVERGVQLLRAADEGGTLGAKPDK